MGLLRTMVWLPSVVFRLIMKGDLLHTKNNITLRWSSNHHKTLMLRLPHDISLLSFHYSKLVSIKGLATFQELFVNTWLTGHLFEQSILVVAMWSVEWWCEITNQWPPSSRSYRLGFNESFSNGEWHYCSEKPGFLVRLGHIFDWQLARWRSFRPSMKNAVVVLLLCSTPRSRCPTVPIFFLPKLVYFDRVGWQEEKSHKKMLKLVKFVFLSCQWRQQSSCYASLLLKMTSFMLLLLFS